MEDNYISENESANLCGVSVETLNRFIETGYLQVEHDSDGLRLFSKSELKRVFGFHDSDLRQNSAPTFSSYDNTARKVEPKPFEQIIKPKLHVVPDKEEPEEPKTTPKIPEAKIIARGTPLTEKISVLGATQPVVHKPAATTEDTEQYKREILKLKNVVSLLEKVLDLREEQIESLKKREEWLEERIHKMEERSEREQVLLLAENETVRKLLWRQQRSSFRAALEWFGLVQPSNYQTATIQLGDKKD